MGFHGFRERTENNDNKESKMENSEKRQNQILEIPKEYKDDFESKVSVEKKQDTEKKEGMFSKIKEMMVGESKKSDKLEKQEDKKTEKSRKESFLESLQVNESPQEIEKRNKEHGYSAEGEVRPKGGFERERSLPKEGKSVYDTLENDSSDGR